MNRENKTHSLSQMLKSQAFSKLMGKDRINRAVKDSTIFSFWTNIVGAKFSNISKPYALKANKLYVCAKSSVVVQELSLYKNKILNKLNTFSKPLGVEIKDIIFNYKNFTMSVPKTLQGIEDRALWLSEDEINAVNINSDVEEKIRENIDKINFLNENQKESFLSKIITSEKAKIIRKEIASD